jgi:capsular polysaccharide export protein
MDGLNTLHESSVGRLTDGPRAAHPRSFLFLQGPISDFNVLLARALVARGHRVHRVNLHLGDQLFWRLPATHFRGRFEEWRGFIGDVLDAHAVTDLIVHGDRRPYHIVAAEEARARGIPVIASDLGYVRPDWVTLEYDGLTTYSRFPRDPEAIRALAEEFPPPDLQPRFRGPSFAYIATLDVIYNFALVLGGPLYPHYRVHGIYHPFAEYIGWIWTLARQYVTRRSTIAAKSRLAATPRSYFLFPLQLATDYQIRAHSPFIDGRDAVRQVISSYAASGTSRKLAIAIHPLDNGLINWRRLAMGIAGELGVADRVVVLDCGTPNHVLRNAAGVVTINSTSGLTALHEGLPVKVLGHAIFDVPGLTHQGDLDGFWNDPVGPDREFLATFARALVGTTQIKGGYYEAESKKRTVAAFVERLEERPYKLPPLNAAELAARQTKTGASVSIAGAGGGVALALARVFAEPGVRLCLIGSASDDLERAAEDCRHRGAVVDLCTDTLTADTFLQDFDSQVPVDRLIVDQGSGLSVDATVEGMKGRGYGQIVVIEESVDVGRGFAPASFGRARSNEIWRARLSSTNLVVSVIRPSRLAVRLASLIGREDLLNVSPERAALVITKGVARLQATIALPGAATVVARAFRILPRAVYRWARVASTRPLNPIKDDTGEAVLRREPGAGN